MEDTVVAVVVEVGQEKEGGRVDRTGVMAGVPLFPEGRPVVPWAPAGTTQGRASLETRVCSNTDWTIHARARKRPVRRRQEERAGLRRVEGHSTTTIEEEGRSEVVSITLLWK